MLLPALSANVTHLLICIICNLVDKLIVSQMNNPISQHERHNDYYDGTVDQKDHQKDHQKFIDIGSDLMELFKSTMNTQFL